jgi:threonine/homoserine/homoserine lactone efflux protein
VLGRLLAFLGVALLVIVVPGPDTALTVRNALTGGRRCGVATAAGVATGQAVWTIATSVGIAELIQASEPAFLALKLAGAAYLIALGLQSLWTAVRPSLTGLRTGARCPFAGRWAAARSPFGGLWTASRLPVRDRLRSPTGGPGSGGSRCGAPGMGAARPGWGNGAAGVGSRAAGGGSGEGFGSGGSRWRGPRSGRLARDGSGRRAGRSGAGGSGAGARAGLRPRRAFRQGVVSNLANPKMAAFFLSLLPQFAGTGRGAGAIVVLGLVFCLMTFAWLALYSAVVDRARVVLGRPRVRRVLEGVSGVVLVGFGARLATQQR